MIFTVILSYKVGDKVYAAPYNAPCLLVLDTVTEEAYGVSTEHVHSGAKSWVGITAVGAKVFAAPYNAPSMLVLDTATGAVYPRAEQPSEHGLTVLEAGESVFQKLF